MSSPDASNDGDSGLHGQDKLLEHAIAEFLIAEDSGTPFDIESWLARYASVRDKLLVFLDDNRLTMLAARSPKRSTALEETSVYFGAGSNSTVNPFSNSEPPQQIGGFRIIKLIGQGGMGRVYEVQDEQQHRFALKLISPQFATSPEAMQRFRQEGAIASSINHPRSVFVHSADQVDGSPYIAMELMSGTTLRDLVRSNGPLPYREAVAKIIDVIDGLQAAHDRGLIHRDVKPSNCYLEADGRVKVGDFGLARQVEGVSELTQTGAVVGTPLFASPEQLLGSPLDIRTDVYSVSATLYFLLTGNAPFEHSNPLTVIARSMTDSPTPIRSLLPEVPSSLEQTLLNGLQRNLNERIPDLQELRSQLTEHLPGSERIKTLSLRFVAYMVDIGVFTIVALVVSFTALGLGTNTIGAGATIALHVAIALSQWAYFFLLESFFGMTVGKRLAGVKVQLAEHRSPPGWWRCLARTTLWWCLCGILSDLFLYYAYGIEVGAGVSIWQWLGYVILHAINCAPLLWRSDQRLLHEVLSGTEVRLLPERKPSQSTDRNWPSLLVASSDSRPWNRLGRFEVVGAMMELKGTRWYLGSDPTLSRDVWIATRNQDAPDVSAKRRACARTTRLRWVASGNQVGFKEPVVKWDVFLAPDALNISRLQEARVAMDWAQTRCAIEGLVDEFEASRRDGIDVPPCNLDFVQLRQDGSVVWIDHLGDNAKSESKHVDTSDDEQEVLRLTHTVASNLLSIPCTNQSAHVATPLYASTLLDRFADQKRNPWSSIGELRSELKRIRNRPSFVNMRMRLIQVVTQATLALAAFGAVLSLMGIGTLSQLDQCESIILRVEAVRYLLNHPDTVEENSKLASHRFFSPNEREAAIQSVDKLLRYFQSKRDDAASCLWQIDTTTRASYDEVLIDAGMLASLRPQISLGEKAMFAWQLPETISAEAGSTDASTETTQEMRNAFAKRASFSEAVLVDTLSKLELGADAMAFPKRPRCLVIAVLPWVIAVLWGVFWRGGISRWFAGIAIVDSSGRLASRWRLLFRSTLLWSPFGLLILAMIVPPLYGFSSSALANSLRALYFLLPVVYLASGLLAARRMLHDRISGTWAVPM